MATNKERFAEAYAAKLKAAIEKHPNDYMNTPDQADALAVRMTEGLVQGTANLSDVARAAARQLGIAPTYKGIKAFCLADARVIFTMDSGREIECSPANKAWWEWSRQSYIGFLEKFGPTQSAGFCHMEQCAIRSNKEKVCMSCGDPGHAEYPSSVVKCVPTYWLCKECDDAQKAKYEDEFKEFVEESPVKIDAAGVAR